MTTNYPAPLAGEVNKALADVSIRIVPRVDGSSPNGVIANERNSLLVLLTNNTGLELQDVELNVPSCVEIEPNPANYEVNSETTLKWKTVPAGAVDRPPDGQSTEAMTIRPIGVTAGTKFTMQVKLGAVKYTLIKAPNGPSKLENYVVTIAR